MSSNQDLLNRARKHIPGGVNSPVRAFNGVGGDPVFFSRAEGACLYDTLIAFCNFMGLSTGCTKRFVRHVESEVGRSARDLDVARLMAGHTPAPLLVHARNDREIPYEAVATIKRALSGATVWSANDLGHRKIVRDPTIASVVQQFVTTGTVAEQEVATAK